MSNARAVYTKVAAPSRPEAVIAKRGEMFQYLMVVMIILTAVSIFHVWSRVKIIDVNLRIAEATKVLKLQKEENERLKVEVASRKNPARLEALAKGELGMSFPSDQQVVMVK